MPTPIGIPDIDDDDVMKVSSIESCDKDDVDGDQEGMPKMPPPPTTSIPIAPNEIKRGINMIAEVIPLIVYMYSSMGT